jgi:UPF0271 protein
MLTVDLNCDLGEGYGEDVIPYITSANIACGFHAGDPGIMRRTVKDCIRHGVAVGAHPGYPDKEGFGRRMMDLGYDELVNLILYQAGALQAIAAAEGTKVRHIKVHGALYNLAARDEKTAAAVVEAVTLLGGNLFLFAPFASVLERIGRQKGLAVAVEVFADRNYHNDGTLVSRENPRALLQTPAQVAARAAEVVTQGRIQTADGGSIKLIPDTICLHGDTPGAVKSACMIRMALLDAGINLAAPVPKSAGG